jgi:hypothetical protein
MTLHLIKLSVGTESVDDLREWQEGILAKKRRARQKPELFHWTRMMPKKKAEVLDGGSIYWVIKGYIRARQRVLDLDQRIDGEGQPYCAIVLDPPLIPTALRSFRAFQGWRYLDPADAPPDAAKASGGKGRARQRGEPSEAMLAELKNLGLL